MTGRDTPPHRCAPHRKTRARETADVTRPPRSKERPAPPGVDGATGGAMNGQRKHGHEMALAGRQRRGGGGASALVGSRPRHQPERRAPLQRAAGAVAHPPPRQPRQGRDRAPDRPVGADHHRHHAPARSRRPGGQAGTAARQDRPALGALRAQSGRRLFARPQDRPPQQPTSCSSTSSAAVRQIAARDLSPTRRRPAFSPSSQRGIAQPDRRPRARSRRAGSPGLGIAAPFELWNWEEEIGAPRAVLDQWRSFDVRAEIARALPLAGLLLQRRDRRLRRRAGARQPRPLSRFPLFLHRLVHRRRRRPQRQPLSRAAPAMPAPSARCRSPRRQHGEPPRPQQFIRSASIYRPRSTASLAAGRDAVDALALARRLGRSRRSRSTPGSSEAAESIAFADRRGHLGDRLSRRVIIDGAFPSTVAPRIVERRQRQDRGFRPAGPLAGDRSSRARSAAARAPSAAPACRSSPTSPATAKSCSRKPCRTRLSRRVADGEAANMIVCCGEALIDFLPRTGADGATLFQPFAGGSVLNVAIAVGRLGAPAGFFSGLSTDFFGDDAAQGAARQQGRHPPRHRQRPADDARLRHARSTAQARYAFFDEGSAGRMLTDSRPAGHPGRGRPRCISARSASSASRAARRSRR